jgi:hypothetical protein
MFTSCSIRIIIVLFALFDVIIFDPLTFEDLKS